MAQTNDKKYMKCDFIEPSQFDHDENDCENDMDTRCGACCFRPKWIQKFASKKIYSLAFGIFGLAVFGEMSAFQGTLSTLEKNFGLSAKVLGSLKTVSQTAGVVGNFLVYGADRGNKIRWISFASFLFFLGCICFIVPIFSSTSLQNINAHRIGSDNISLIVTSNKESSCHKDSNKLGGFFKNFIILPFIVSQSLLGFANAIQRSCGFAYLDNNMRRNIFPIWYAGICSTQWFGYGLGLIIVSFALKFFVFPGYTVNITNSDPRWIGAWWIPSLIFSVVGLLLTPIFLLFPKSLPRAAERNSNKKVPTKKISCGDFFKSIRAVLGNKILMCEAISSTTFTLGFIATFWPKYIEIQFGMTASKSSLIQGLIEFLSRPLGMFTSSILIMKLKPRPRTLLGGNLVLTCLCFVTGIILAFSKCGNEQVIRGHMDQRNNWELTEQCNARFRCSENLEFAPVCDKSQIFFSSCHAGCESTSIRGNKTFFTNCDCMEKSINFLEEGLCRPDCTSAFTIYILLIGLIKILKAGARSIKVLVEFRSMEDSEKSFSIGILRTISSLFSVIPGIILYGSILDSSCLVWSNKCGVRGNCWLYDTNKLRYMFFATSSAFMGISMIMDLLLCIYVKSLKIYDEDFIENVAANEIKNPHETLRTKLLT